MGILAEIGNSVREKNFADRLKIIAVLSNIYLLPSLHFIIFVCASYITQNTCGGLK